MIAGPRAKRVEAPEGAFPSLTAAAKHLGISRKRGGAPRKERTLTRLRPIGHATDRTWAAKVGKTPPRGGRNTQF